MSNKKQHKKVNLTSDNLSDEKSTELKKIFPEVFTENKIDWEKLQTVLGEDVDFGREKFGFTWSGKSNAIKSVLIPSKATLKPQEKESVDFDKSQNLFIEGDNLEVLKLLQKSYFEKVKMIYIDPPYNTGGDFVYKDNFASPLENYLEQTGQKDSSGNSLQTNKESSGRFHSDWLSMMYPRLKLAWNLLKKDGVIFISIDDNEVHHLRMVMNEIFGEENFVQNFMWLHGKGKKDKNSRTLQQYIVCYAKNKELLPSWSVEKIKNYKLDNPDNDERGGWFSGSISFSEERSNKNHKNYFSIKSPSGIVWERQWQCTKAEMDDYLQDKRIYFGPAPEYSNVPRLKIFPTSEEIIPPNIIDDVGSTRSAQKELDDLLGGSFFSNPKPVELIEHLIKLACNEKDIVLDFFAGSCTTAHSVMKINSNLNHDIKWVCVQLPEKLEENTGKNAQEKKMIKDAIEFLKKKNKPLHISEISKERVRRAIQVYFDNSESIDAGFKAFTLDQSNYPINNFEFDPEKSEEENINSFKEYLKKAEQKSLFGKVNNKDIIYENIVKEGLSLNSLITKEKIGKNTFEKVTDQEKELLICLDEKLDKDTIKALTTSEYKNKTVICLDDALDDSAKSNLALNTEIKTI